MKNTPSDLNSSKHPRAPSEVPASPDTNATAFTPSAEDVAYRAYLKHQNHGMPDGRDLADWLGAEAELIAEHQLTNA